MAAGAYAGIARFYEVTRGAAQGFVASFINWVTKSQAARKIIELVQNRIPARFGLDPIREVQVLCPMNWGRLGARALNVDLQAALNGDQSTPSVVRFGCSFRSGDKVMQTINDDDKDVFQDSGQ